MMATVLAYAPDNEILDFLLSGPTPEQIIALRPSSTMQERMAWLLDGSRNNTLNDAERTELKSYAELEHFVRRLKIRAQERLHMAKTG